VTAPREPAAHSTRSARSGQADELEAFAAAVAHELRTPLAALSGEVDLALRRERTAAAYRDALSRIAVSVAELIELTGDLTFLGQESGDDPPTGRRARLDRILARVGERYASTLGIEFTIDPAASELAVVGDEGLLARAVTLVVEHAVRHRRERARVTVRAARLDAAGVEIVVEGGEDAFWPHTWESLSPPADEPAPASALGSGPLRLRTADRIIRRCGGTLHADRPAAAPLGVHIRLRGADPE
jgi:two-component system OmpR family sensor kinase